jgi:excisionase family DNA binding protein
MKRKLTAPEVADLLRLSVEHLYDLVKSGVVPAQRLSPRGKLLFDPDEVQAALRRAGQPERELADTGG